MIKKFVNWLRGIFTTSNEVKIVEEKECECKECTCNIPVEIKQPAVSNTKEEKSELYKKDVKKVSEKIDNTKKTINKEKPVKKIEHKAKNEKAAGKKTEIRK